MTNKKGLGRGLGALINDDESKNENNQNNEENIQRIIEVDINKIEPNQEQPRNLFDETSLQEMADSMKSIGVIQPLTVKKDGQYYKIVAGERRWRAARIAKLKTVPVIVKDYDELETIEVSLIENIQRENLNPLEEANTYKRLSEEFNLNQEDIANKVGKSRTAVANVMRLLNLDKRVQNFLLENKLTSGHARALLSIQNSDIQFEIAEKIIEEQFSVRYTEEFVKKYIDNIQKTDKINQEEKNETEGNVIYKNIANDLKTILGTKVNIKNGKNKGKIEIEYYSNDELDRLIGIFKQIK